jgi:hypothetical protein
MIASDFRHGSCRSSVQNGAANYGLDARRRGSITVPNRV